MPSVECKPERILSICSASAESGQQRRDFVETLFVTSLIRRFENVKDEKE